MAVAKMSEVFLRCKEKLFMQKEKNTQEKKYSRKKIQTKNTRKLEEIENYATSPIETESC